MHKGPFQAVLRAHDTAVFVVHQLPGIAQIVQSIVVANVVLVVDIVRPITVRHGKANAMNQGFMGYTIKSKSDLQIATLMGRSRFLACVRCIENRIAATAACANFPCEFPGHRVIQENLVQAAHRKRRGRRLQLIDKYD